MPMPDIEQQREGARLFAKVNELRRFHEETSIELDRLLPGILAKAFTGQR